MDVWSFLQQVGGIVGPLLVVLLGVYLFPGSPLKKIIDEWIGRRVSYHFDQQLENHRHELTLVADAVRAGHQRRLQNSAIVAERKHEVCRRLFRLPPRGDGEGRAPLRRHVGTCVRRV